MSQKKYSRRLFVQSAAILGLTAAVAPDVNAMLPRSRMSGPLPLCIASGNGLGATTKAMELMNEGRDTLDAVIAGVNLVEDDPEDTSVGYGGLPNEDGVVELDSCVMHGPSGRGAGVACLRNIKNPSRVAKVVMERTDHVLIVGDGALRFAKAHGFREEDLLTDRARREWLEWKETLSDKDDWLPPHGIEDRNIGSVLRHANARHTGTINCLAVNTSGEVSGCTTTSGLAFKIPGRVGDSPILGAGLYVDNAVGAAGSTGRGEANLLALSSFLIVERMRMGDKPTDACLFACRRIAEQTKMKRLLDDQGRPRFNVNFYALNKQGAHGAASLWSGSAYAVNDGGESRLLDCAALYTR